MAPVPQIFSSVALDDAMHDGESDAGAGEFLVVMQPLKHTEEFLGIGHVEAGAIVAHKVGGLAVGLLLAAEFDAAALSAAGEFPSIAEEFSKAMWSRFFVAPASGDGGRW